jgi:protein-L-isoaspartate(D-aspartate) O-methyltransferase
MTCQCAGDENMEARIPTPRRPARTRSVSVALCAGLLAVLLTGLGVTLRTPDRRHAVFATETAGGTQTPSSALQWQRPRLDEREDERRRMVLNQISARGVSDPAVLAAMGHVPRHRFVLPRYLGDAYRDSPLPIGYGQTISQPYVVAFMTELLDLKPGDRVLEIGTGSGYQAAVLSELTPSVFTIEIIDALGAEAAERLASLGYSTIRTKVADGYYGWEESSLFDAIIVTCAAGHIPPPLIEQLRSGGRMVIPVGPVYDVQYLIRVTKNDEGEVRSERLLPVRFVPMTGRVQQGQ